MADVRELSTDPAVKLSGVAALTTDNATVVALSPNSPMPQPDVNTTGTISTTDLVVAAPGGAGALIIGTPTAGSYVVAACTGGYSAWDIQVTGLTSGALYFEASLDSTTGIDGNWINLNGRQTGIVNTVLGGNATTNGIWRGNISAYKYFRVRSSGALSGTPAIVIRLSAGSGAIFLNASIPAGTNSLGTVQQATLTKGTQGATGVSTQDLKDAGRVAISFTAEFSPIAVTEAMLSLSVSKDGAAPSTTTSYVITTGKRLRITSICSFVENTLGTSIQRAYLRMRFAATGGALITSPLQMTVPTAAAGAVKSIATSFEDIPDGLEFLGDGTRAIGFSLQAPDWVTVSATLKVYVTVIGFEY